MESPAPLKSNAHFKPCLVCGQLGSEPHVVYCELHLAELREQMKALIPTYRPRKREPYGKGPKKIGPHPGNVFPRKLWEKALMEFCKDV